jgi:hypothetical protein
MIQPTYIRPIRISDDAPLTFDVIAPPYKPKGYPTFRAALDAHPDAVLHANAVHAIVEDALRRTGRI